MAQGFARKCAPAGTGIWSAGIEAHGLNPRAVSTMQERGIDISGQESKTLSGIPLEKIDRVITLCGHAEDTCPAFPRPIQREYWPLCDPTKAAGTEEEILEAFREVRDEIERRITLLWEMRPTNL